jgi:hypothetical protein
MTERPTNARSAVDPALIAVLSACALAWIATFIAYLR